MVIPLVITALALIQPWIDYLNIDRSTLLTAFPFAIRYMQYDIHLEDKYNLRIFRR